MSKTNSQHFLAATSLTELKMCFITIFDKISCRYNLIVFNKNHISVQKMLMRVHCILLLLSNRTSNSRTISWISHVVQPARGFKRHHTKITLDYSTHASTAATAVLCEETMCVKLQLKWCVTACVKKSVEIWSKAFCSVRRIQQG